MNRVVFIVAIFLFCHLKMGAQIIPVTTEQQLENLSASDENQSKNDAYLQELYYWRKHPLDINSATADDWRRFRFLNELQIQSLVQYRQLLGKFLSVYELQAVPRMDMRTLRTIAPYITMNNFVDAAQFKQRFSKGAHTILLRERRIIETQKGFLPTTSKRYLGSPDHVLLRYRYQYKTALSYGFTGDKDAGEPFGKGAQSKGFDFYSFHFFAQHLGIVDAIALGDFTVNMGQGLIQWQSLSFKKSAEATAIKRQDAFLLPYSSAGETNFNRGVGLTLAKRNWRLSTFGSYKKLSANLVADTLLKENYITSLSSSGLHRTAAEISDRNSVSLSSFGGNIRYQKNNFHVGINALACQFSHPWRKRREPYNQFEMRGRELFNYSTDYSLTYHNLHFFGEAAADKKGARAFLNGMLLSVDPKVDIALLYRNFGAQYRSLFGNAFTENTLPQNEKGLYTGITIRPAGAWKIHAYADFYQFPWLKYRVDAPSFGSDYLLQCVFQPSKAMEIYGRFKFEQKQMNSGLDSVMHQVRMVPRQNFRLNLMYIFSTSFTLKARTELSWYNRNNENGETGYLTYLEGDYKPFRPASFNMRLQYFETDGYNSRIYAYENDVLYGYSVPSFFDKGFRYYLNCNYELSKRISMWLRWAQTIYKNKKSIGSGLDQIKGNSRSDATLQVVYGF